ncbi:unnamed protein product [Adineta ricciae]|uniref:Uncharacterized protein n=1 Tax=Adineta ricciae TaxID=249248 RepID=A0A813WXC2_ADIRI|nr:unnamed protein product [Adineta ricciae]CAF1161185.1 unnamed protein product [Adineta ricciae]
MNATDDISIIYGVCTSCQISYGFNSADRRAMIVLIVLAAVALVSCYVGVIWFTIRTRYIPEKAPLIPMENIVTNQAFDRNDGEEDNVQVANNVSTPTTPSTPQPAVITVSEDPKERF